MLYLASCNQLEEKNHRFSLVPVSESGVDFNNTIASTDSLNILSYIYFYNGGGVGVGDINNDGLQDLYFAGNQVSSKLYLNLGDLRFKDITAAAGVTTEKWCTGVSMVDINADGLLDIYLGVAGHQDASERANLLFLNNGDLTFTEAASAYGLADTAYSTHSAFFDYDLDGDLDLYLLNHANEREALNTPLPKKVHGEGASTDKLFRNDGGHFTDVSRDSGISIEGYGLGVSVSDLNHDGWSDIYVSNDFITNDLLYINNTDGTFSNSISDAISEQTYNGMGNDIADFNNDGLPDVMVVDMLPPNPVREKTMAGSMTADKYRAIQSAGYEPQFVRNTLQLGQGGMNFTEIGRYAGIHRTDWSWAPLFADFDNDGWKDLYITNGYLKDITDKDFIDYNYNLTLFKSKEESDKEALLNIEKLKGVKLSNYAFQNNGDLTFADFTQGWGMYHPSFSNGAAYADLDNDGDLDLVVNNINDPAFILRNDTDSTQNFLQIKLRGPGQNLRGMGTKVQIKHGNVNQIIEQSVYRGFMSSVDDIVHFGLPKNQVDSVEITWPDGKSQILKNIKANQRIVVDYADARQNQELASKTNPRMKEVEGLFDFDSWRSQDKLSVFKTNPLLPYRFSNDGVKLAVGDFDGNGSDDLFVSGSNGLGSIFFQETDATFLKKNIGIKGDCWVADALASDINGDGIDDLFLACEGKYHLQNIYQDRLFLGNSSGNLLESKTWLEAVTTSASCVASADYDNDGDLDLFVGGYTEPGNYPEKTRSYLLRNDGEKFTDVTNDFAPDLLYPGMIRDAVWADYNNDDQVDLILAGDWMPIKVFENGGGSFEDKTETLGLQNYSGQWQSILSTDIDFDGDIDFLCGNIGLNSGYSATADKPMELYQADINKDGILDPLMTYFVNDETTLHPSREPLLRQQPFLNRIFPNHLSYAKARVKDIVPQEEIGTINVLKSTFLASAWLENKGGQAFKVTKLPPSAQFYPITTQIIDKNINNTLSLILAGGYPEAEPDGKSYGMSNSLINLTKSADTEFKVKEFFHHSGAIVSMVNIKIGENKMLIAGFSDGEIKVFEIF
ncbi:MAG: VCBS repeat-containing protein [Cyclobacteriaceae bacterium]